MGIMEVIRSWESFPPGYEAERERFAGGLLLCLPLLCSPGYFVRMYETVQGLYYIDRIQGRMIREGAVATHFWQLAGGYGMLFLPFFLFLMIMAGQHYAYYCRESKSIYTMKRLPGRGILLRSCIQAPLLGMAVGVGVLAVLFLFYCGAYLLFIPRECRTAFL